MKRPTRSLAAKFSVARRALLLWSPALFVARCFDSLRTPRMGRLRRLPPLNALTIFEASSLRPPRALHGQPKSCSSRQCAVSHQVKALEVELGEEQRLSKTYWIICPQATTNLPKIATFR